MAKHIEIIHVEAVTHKKNNPNGHPKYDVLFTESKMVHKAETTYDYPTCGSWRAMENKWCEIEYRYKRNNDILITDAKILDTELNQ